MESFLDDGLERYIEAHTTPEDDLWTRLRGESDAAFKDPDMAVGPVQGRLLRLLVMISGARRVLEIGTFSGYSALFLASGLPADGELLTLDINPETTALARRFFAESPWRDKIRLRLGPALDSLRDLAADGARFDLVFLDADKEAYVEYWEAVVPLVPSGGLILADNALWSGRVLAPEEASDHAVVAFNDRVRRDPRVEHVLLSIRDGLMLARKR